MDKFIRNIVKKLETLTFDKPIDITVDKAIKSNYLVLPDDKNYNINEPYLVWNKQGNGPMRMLSR